MVRLSMIPRSHISHRSICAAQKQTNTSRAAVHTVLGSLFCVFPLASVLIMHFDSEVDASTQPPTIPAWMRNAYRGYFLAFTLYFVLVMVQAWRRRNLWPFRAR
jgi:hypothetical protein